MGQGRQQGGVRAATGAASLYIKHALSVFLSTYFSLGIFKNSLTLSARRVNRASRTAPLK